tara:strand:+ start:642 stop:1118 length:477 start_codon:yes stop_codon:yes gene_type:complete
MPKKSRSASSSPDSFHSAKGISRSNSAKSKPRIQTRRTARAAAKKNLRFKDEIITPANFAPKSGNFLTVKTQPKDLERLKLQALQKERTGPGEGPLGPTYFRWREEQQKKARQQHKHKRSLDNLDREFRRSGEFTRIGGKKKTKRRRKNTRRTKRRKC